MGVCVCDCVSVRRRSKVPSGSRHEFLLENEDSGTNILFLMVLLLWMFVSCVVFLVDAVNIKTAGAVELYILSIKMQLYITYLGA